MKSPVQEIQQRTARYWYIDGLAELIFALTCLLLGLYFYFQASLPEESTLYKILNLSLVVIIFGAGFGANRVLSYLKNRITYPRTGFVSYRHSRSKLSRWIGGVAAILMGMLTAGMMVKAPASLAWMPAVTGFILAVVLLILGFRVGLVRFYFLAVAALGIGFGLSLAGIGDILGLGMFYLSMAVALVVSGGYTLWNYLRQTAVPEEEIDGRRAE